MVNGLLEGSVGVHVAAGALDGMRDVADGTRSGAFE